MPRYKVECRSRGCETPAWWVKRTGKLDEAARAQLRHSICQDCADYYRRQYRSVKSGVLELDDAGRAEVAAMILRLQQNNAYGLEHLPIRDVVWDRLAEDRKTVRNGLHARYRDYSATREMLRYRWSILGAEHVLREAGLPLTPPPPARHRLTPEEVASLPDGSILPYAYAYDLRTVHSYQMAEINRLPDKPGWYSFTLAGSAEPPVTTRRGNEVLFIHDPEHCVHGTQLTAAEMFIWDGRRAAQYPQRRKASAA